MKRSISARSDAARCWLRATMSERSRWHSRQTRFAQASRLIPIHSAMTPRVMPSATHVKSCRSSAEMIALTSRTIRMTTRGGGAELPSGPALMRRAYSEQLDGMICSPKRSTLAAIWLRKRDDAARLVYKYLFRTARTRYAEMLRGGLVRVVTRRSASSDNSSVMHTPHSHRGMFVLRAYASSAGRKRARKAAQACGSPRRSASTSSESVSCGGSDDTGDRWPVSGGDLQRTPRRYQLALVSAYSAYCGAYQTYATANERLLNWPMVEYSLR